MSQIELVYRMNDTQKYSVVRMLVRGFVGSVSRASDFDLMVKSAVFGCDLRFLTQK